MDLFVCKQFSDCMHRVSFQYSWLSHEVVEKPSKGCSLGPQFQSSPNFGRAAFVNLTHFPTCGIVLLSSILSASKAIGEEKIKKKQWGLNIVEGFTFKTVKN